MQLHLHQKTTGAYIHFQINRKIGSRASPSAAYDSADYDDIEVVTLQLMEEIQSPTKDSLLSQSLYTSVTHLQVPFSLNISEVVPFPVSVSSPPFIMDNNETVTERSMVIEKGTGMNPGKQLIENIPITLLQLVDTPPVAVAMDVSGNNTNEDVNVVGYCDVLIGGHMSMRGVSLVRNSSQIGSLFPSSLNNIVNSNYHSQSTNNHNKRNTSLHTLGKRCNKLLIQRDSNIPTSTHAADAIEVLAGPVHLFSGVFNYPPSLQNNQGKQVGMLNEPLVNQPLVGGVGNRGGREIGGHLPLEVNTLVVKALCVALSSYSDQIKVIRSYNDEAIIEKPDIACLLSAEIVSIALLIQAEVCINEV